MASRDAISSVRKRAVVQLGRTLEWGSRGRGFKSRQPEIMMVPLNKMKRAAIVAIALSAIASQVYAQQKQSVTLNPAALLNSFSLISEGCVVADRKGSWQQDKPSRSKENEFIRNRGIEEYGKWHLGIDNRYSPRSKAHYKFPFGDFGAVHRCGLLAVEARAKQYGYRDIEAAAIQLLTDLESARPRAQKHVD